MFKRLIAITVVLLFLVGSSFAFDKTAGSLKEFEGWVKGGEFTPVLSDGWVDVTIIGHAECLYWDYNSKENMAYAARVGLELGADIVKINYNGNAKDLEWAVKSAGRCKVVIAGGVKENEKDFLKNVKDIINSGASGLAIGRNIWQSSNPL